MHCRRQGRRFGVKTWGLDSALRLSLQSDLNISFIIGKIGLMIPDLLLWLYVNEVK